MAGKYSKDDLLNLRASPLVRDPSNLSAIQDIISPADTTTKRPTTRAKTEEPTTQPEGFPKRPLLDSQHRKSTTDPERIVLGPPRRSFASSNARAAKGSSETTDDTNIFSKTAAFEKFRNGETQESKRSDQIDGRHPARNEVDVLSEKPKRMLEEEHDVRPKRDIERRTKWGPGDEDSSHRNKFGPWARHDRGGESLDDTKRDGRKQNDWRNDRGRDRWDRPAQPEEEPEWMDEPVDEVAAPARTQEDFQKWKERMKAGKSSTSREDEAIATPSSPEPASVQSTRPSFLDAENDDSMDRFLARITDAKAPTQPSVNTKAPTKTRFASLFSPQAEQPPQQAVPPQPSSEPQERMRTEQITPPPSVAPSGDDADQAGFARILQMLQGRSNAAATQVQEQKTRVPLFARDTQSTQDTERNPSATVQGLLHQPRPPIAEEQPSLAKHSSGTLLDLLNRPRPMTNESQTIPIRERPQDSRSPVDKNPLYQSLLQQASQALKPTPASPPREQYGMRPLFSNEDALNRSAMARNQMISPIQQSEQSIPSRRENGRHTYDEGQHMRYQEEPAFLETLSRRATNETHRPANEDQLLAYLRSQGMPQPQKAMQSSQHQQGPPPGLGRPPPGLDTYAARPPPGWPAQPSQSQSQSQGQPTQRLTAPPPGMSNIPRNPPAQYPGPAMQSHQQPNQRVQQGPQPQQRKYTGESGLPNFPPMGPPPGFMNNGPPPGFPGTGYGRYNGPPEPGPPQGLGRAFMDPYGDVGRAGVRGGNGGMPGYR